MARWREQPGAARGSALWHLLDAERLAVAARDPERLAEVRSWLRMLGTAGDDPELAELFAAFATETGATVG